MTIFNNISKRDKVLLSLLVVCLITVSLYQTLATDVTMNKTNVASVDMSYTFDITDQTGRVVKVSAGSTKVLDIFLTNNNNGTISYGIAYTPSSVKNDKITIAQMSSSKDSVSGTINKNEKKQISLVIINNSSSDITLTLVPVTGYEHGGDLIVPSNHTLISDVTLPESVNAADYITSLVSSNPDTMNNDDPGKNVRYMGADPNNYVSFNGELWRIIGVFDVKSSVSGSTEKRVKIIRNESLGNKAWNSSNVNDWSKASLQTYLNGEYYNSLDSTSKSLIGDTYWNLGGTSSYTSSSNGLASHFYGYERGTTVYSGRPTHWIGKIGLMYPSDYGYATSGGAKTNRASCLAKELYNWDSSSYSDCKNNDYLYTSKYQWTITPRSSSSSNIFNIYTSGYVSATSSNSSTRAVTPVLYLKSNVEITGGSGTSTSPYKISPVPATDTITSIFTSADKTTVTNNSVEYEYATSVGMMEDIGGNIRYYGADPNNYVKFNNELWRIIGVFKDIDDGTGKKETRLKIARNESIGNYAWDSNDMNEWSTATLNTYLNGTYLNSLTSEAQAMVGNAKWNLGGSSSYSGLYADDYYTFERGTTVYFGRSTKWTGKIALMYPSDYMYAGDLSKCSKDGYNWDTDQTNCRDTSWLRNASSIQWTITPNSSYSYFVFYVSNSGFVANSYGNFVTNSNASRPVLFLTSTVQITGGEGTQSNPYTLG